MVCEAFIHGMTWSYKRQELLQGAAVQPWFGIRNRYAVQRRLIKVPTRTPTARTQLYVQNALQATIALRIGAAPLEVLL